MTPPRLNGQAPRLALSVDEAAASLGIHRDTFDARVLPRLKTVPVGRRRLVPVAELERYLKERAV